MPKPPMAIDMGSARAEAARQKGQDLFFGAQFTMPLAAEQLGRLPHPEPFRMIEIGAGAGYAIARLLPYLPETARVTLLDLEPGILEIARENLAEVNIETLVGNIVTGEGLEAKAQAYDAAYVRLLLQHLPGDGPIIAIKNIARLLAAPGSLVAEVMTHNAENWGMQAKATVPHLQKFAERLVTLYKRQDRWNEAGDLVIGWLTDAGFDIQHETLRHPDKLARGRFATMIGLVRGVQQGMLKSDLMTPGEIEELIAGLEKEKASDNPFTMPPMRQVVARWR